MRALFFTSSFVLALAALGCASTNEKENGTVADTGIKTDAKTDASVADGDDEDDGPNDSGTPSDSVSPTDTGGGKVDSGPAGGCDKHVGDQCDLVLQNCPNADDSCVYNSSTKANTCAKLTTGPGLKGEACTKNEDCDKGLSCYDDGKCSPACCTGNNAVCGAGGTCSLAITDPSDGKVIYHACSYNPPCNPFKYDCASGQVCLFAEQPFSFKCSTPSAAGGVSKAPGGACKYVNDCGESQVCTEIKTSADAAAGSKCFLFCYLTPPTGFMPGTNPDGRFAANGTCTVNGTSYGTCSMINGIGGGLGVCIP